MLEPRREAIGETSQYDPARAAPPRGAQRAVTEYFEYASAGVEVVEDGLKEVCFGEYLVEQGAIDRQQLFRALQQQDRHPGAYLGECVAALGFVAEDQIRTYLKAYLSAPTFEFD